MHTNPLKAITVTVLGLSLSFAAARALAGPDGERAERFRQRMQERIERMDSDGDGTISRDEYLASAENRFARLDLDGDGYVTSDEREELRAQHRERRENRFP